MAIVDLVKMDVASDDFVVQKFNSEQQWELRLGSQLVVNEGQEAILVKGGIALDVFTPGTHTLVTGNIPFLRKITNSLFDEKTPFTAEVWFINKTVKRNLKWGTPQRIPLFDPQLNFPINIGAFGQWGFRVENSRSFVTQIVGAQLGANSKKIYEYFIGEITEKTSQTIRSTLIICICAKRYFIFAIMCYQRYAKSSTRLKCCCYPSCSQYAIIALQKYGVIIGSFLAIRHCINCAPPGTREFP